VPHALPCIHDVSVTANVEIRDLVVTGRHGPVSVRSYRDSAAAAGAAFVWVHGGGFIAGDLDMPEAHWVSVQLARRGISVLSVEYRKCDGSVHFPVPSDDVVDAWLWALDHADLLGVFPAQLQLGGASAGGNLAAGVTKRLRDGAGPLPRTLLLVYPLVHAVLPPASEGLRQALAARGTDPFNAEVVRALNVNFTGSVALFEDPYAFAANGDVAGQPPVYILNSEADSLRSSGEAYGNQLGRAGVPVLVEFEPGTGHGHLNEPLRPGAVGSIERMATWLRGSHGHRAGD
jgi:acetyl esterase